MKPGNFGSNLNKILKVLGISQTELAEKSGLTPGAVSQILNGKNEASLGSICKILSVIPIKFERLVE